MKSDELPVTKIPVYGGYVISNDGLVAASLEHMETYTRLFETSSRVYFRDEDAYDEPLIFMHDGKGEIVEHLPQHYVFSSEDQLEDMRKIWQGEEECLWSSPDFEPWLTDVAEEREWGERVNPINTDLQVTFIALEQSEKPDNLDWSTLEARLEASAGDAERYNSNRMRAQRSANVKKSTVQR